MFISSLFISFKANISYYFDNYIKISESLAMDHDDFYSHLPFTLTPQQTTPQYVILGTGLQECLIAAYKSKSEGKTGLIIDIDRTYGSSLKTVSLKEFHQLSSGQREQKMYSFITPQTWLANNKTFFDECIGSNKYRGYNMDIEPNFFFASSITCECLKDADMDKYMDFHLVNNILHIDGGSFQPVPLSKGKIFESKGLSLLQKKTLLMSIHKLIKIYHKYMKLQQDINSTKQFDKGFGDIQESLYKQFEEALNNPFNTFLEKLTKKNKKIINYLTYIICNYQYNYTQAIPDFAKSNYTLRGFIQRFGKFIKSCGIYGESPYLYVDNGIGDIPQSFSRIASIYGSTYILHPKITIDAIQSNEQGLIIRSNLSPEVPIRTKQLFFGPTYLHLTEGQSYHSQHNLRVLLLCEKQGKEQVCPGICYLNDFPLFQNPVYLFMFDGSTQSCPQEYILYQFETIISSEQAEDPSLSSKSQVFLKVLVDIYGEGFIESVKYFSSYVRTRRYPKQTAALKDKVLLNDTMGIDLDQHFLNFVSVVGQKEHYFKKDVKGDQEQEPFGGYQTNYILQKLQEINLNEPIKESPVEAQVKVKQEQKQEPQKTHEELQERVQTKQ